MGFVFKHISCDPAECGGLTTQFVVDQSHCTLTQNVVYAPHIHIFNHASGLAGASAGVFFACN